MQIVYPSGTTLKLIPLSNRQSKQAIGEKGQKVPVASPHSNRFPSPETMKSIARIRRVNNRDRVLHYGTVAATVLKDIGNASNQPYLQGIASVALLIMETVQASRPSSFSIHSTD
jgi:hypothetical protein